MLTVEDYARIRRAHRDGMSIRAIAQQFHHSRRKIREALQAPEPRAYTRTQAGAGTKLGPFMPAIDEILEADAGLRPSSGTRRHRSFGDWSKEGYAGGYDQVRRYVRKHRRR